MMQSLAMQQMKCKKPLSPSVKQKSRKLGTSTPISPLIAVSCHMKSPHLARISKAQHQQAMCLNSTPKAKSSSAGLAGKEVRSYGPHSCSIDSREDSRGWINRVRGRVSRRDGRLRRLQYRLVGH